MFRISSNTDFRIASFNQFQTSVVELLINNAHQVGLVDDDLAGRTALMSEVFSTDDELDGSEDNLEDTKENKRKDKKRKRSGSFQGLLGQIKKCVSGNKFENFRYSRHTYFIFIWKRI